MRDGPTSLKPRSRQTKQTRKRKNEDLTLWPLEELIPNPPKSSAASKIATLASSKAQEKPTTASNTPVSTPSTGKMTTTKAQDTPRRFSSPSTGSTGSIPAGSISAAPSITKELVEQYSTAPSIPKELVEQYTLRVRPQPGASVEAIEQAIRSRIESPCGNVVWGSAHARKSMVSSGGGSVAAVETRLEMEVIYHNCSRQGPMPRVCQRMHIVNGRGRSQAHEPLKMEDVVLLVGRGMPELVDWCELVAERNWAVNAISTLE